MNLKLTRWQTQSLHTQVPVSDRLYQVSQVRMSWMTSPLGVGEVDVGPELDDLPHRLLNRAGEEAEAMKSLLDQYKKDVLLYFVSNY